MIEQNCLRLNEKNGTSKGKKSYNLSEIMAILGICRSSATKLVKSNQFRSIRIGREVRIPKSEFDAWLDSNTKEEVLYGIYRKKKKQIFSSLHLHG